MNTHELGSLNVLDTYNKWEIEETKYRLYLHTYNNSNLYLPTLVFNYYIICIYIYNLQYYLLLNYLYLIYYYHDLSLNHIMV